MQHRINCKTSLRGPSHLSSLYTKLTAQLYESTWKHLTFWPQLQRLLLKSRQIMKMRNNLLGFSNDQKYIFGNKLIKQPFITVNYFSLTL